MVLFIKLSGLKTSSNGVKLLIMINWLTSLFGLNVIYDQDNRRYPTTIVYHNCATLHNDNLVKKTLVSFSQGPNIEYRQERVTKTLYARTW